MLGAGARRERGASVVVTAQVKRSLLITVADGVVRPGQGNARMGCFYTWSDKIYYVGVAFTTMGYGKTLSDAYVQEPDSVLTPDHAP